MGAARLYSPLDPAFTDGDWIQDFQFCAGDPNTPESGWDNASLALVKKGLPAESVELTTEADGGLLIVGPGRPGVRVSKAVMTAMVPGEYAFELRRRGNDGSFDVGLTGLVTIFRGLSDVVGGDPPAGPLNLTGASDGTIQTIVSEGLVTIIRSGIGPMGPRGDAAVADIAFSFSGNLLDGERLAGYAIAHAVQLDAASSVARCEVPSAGDVFFQILKNDAQVGRVDFASGTTSGTVSLTDPVLATGDVIAILAPSPADPDLAFVSITLAGSDA